MSIVHLLFTHWSLLPFLIWVYVRNDAEQKVKWLSRLSSFSDSMPVSTVTFIFVALRNLYTAGGRTHQFFSVSVKNRKWLQSYEDLRKWLYWLVSAELCQQFLLKMSVIRDDQNWGTLLPPTHTPIWHLSHTELQNVWQSSLVFCPLFSMSNVLCYSRSCIICRWWIYCHLIKSSNVYIYK